jgi:hypothetical protein
VNVLSLDKLNPYVREQREATLQETEDFLMDRDIQIGGDIKIPKWPIRSFDVNTDNELIMYLWYGSEDGIFVLNQETQCTLSIVFPDFDMGYAGVMWSPDGENIWLINYGENSIREVTREGYLTAIYHDIKDRDLVKKEKTTKAGIKYEMSTHAGPFIVSNTRIGTYSTLTKTEKDGKEVAIHEARLQQAIKNAPMTLGTFGAIFAVFYFWKLRYWIRKRKSGGKKDDEEIKREMQLEKEQELERNKAEFNKQWMKIKEKMLDKYDRRR